MQTTQTFAVQASVSQKVADQEPACNLVRDVSLIVLERRGMGYPADLIAKAFLAIGELKVDVLMISHSSHQGNFCFVVPRASAVSVLNTLRNELKSEFARQEVASLQIAHNVVMLTAATSDPGAASRICQALAERRINILAVAQGKSSVSVIIDVIHEAKAAAIISQV